MSVLSSFTKIFRRRQKDGSGEEMSFVEHLDALRSHLFRAAIAVAAGAIVMAIYNKFIVQRVLMGPTNGDFATYVYLCKISQRLGLGGALCMTEIHVKMQNTQVTGQFNIYFNVILIGGFILAFPYVFWQFWKFTKPALTVKELRNTRGVIFWVSLLFFLGRKIAIHGLKGFAINY